MSRAKLLGALGLNQGDANIYLEVDATQLDIVAYAGSSTGYSAALNTAGDTWLCAAEADVYGTNSPQDHGTPGAANTTTAACP